jgi:site-specific recombinase XerD
LSFKEKLERDMAEDLKSKGRSLETCVDQYLKNVQVTSGTLYKYQNYLGKLSAYAKSKGVTTIEGLEREFIFGYLLHLRNIEKKGNGTIKNTFNTLSTSHNFLITSGKTKDPNPFIGHNLNHEVERRLPFTVADLESIFSSPAILGDKQICFIAMLLVTSVARPNEICQLWTDDIQKDGKIGTIRMVKNDERYQTLKTPDSKRVIYLNRLLIEAGFLGNPPDKPKASEVEFS